MADCRLHESVPRPGGQRLTDFAKGSSFLRIGDFAMYLRVQPALVRKWIHAGTLPAYCFAGQWRIELGEAEAFQARSRYRVQEVG